MVLMDIFENHLLGSAGARVILLAKSIEPQAMPGVTAPADQKGFTELIFRLISSHYESSGQIEHVENRNKLFIKNMNAPYSKVSLPLDSYTWLESCLFYLALALRNSHHGDESGAWDALINASWLAGFGKQLGKTRKHIDVYKHEAITRKASKAATDGHKNTKKTLTQNEIKVFWDSWQLLVKSNPQGAKKLYKNKSAFAYDMLDKFPILAGAKKQDPRVIMRWVRQWENPEQEP